MKINWRKPLIFALLYLSRNKIPFCLKEIKRIERLSLKEKREYQEKKLKELLLYAYQNVPYYHNILKEVGIIENNQVFLENFHKIPILTKGIIRQEGENLYSKDYKKRKFHKNSSGGSTGEPVEFIQDKEYEECNNATKIYYKLLGGQEIGNRELRLWGSERDILEGKEKFSIRLRNWLYNRKELNAFRMSTTKMEEFVKIWNEFKPQWVEAYVQSIYEFAKFIEERKINVYSPKGVLVSAGTLYKPMEETIKRVFKCPVFNRYGSREVGAIACSNGKTGELQISFWHNHVEIVKNNKNQLGKILVTNLNNYSMPLIRYEIGDIGILDKKWGVLKKIEGREMSVFKTKEGKLVPGEFFIHFIGVVFNKGFISKFQVIQKNYDYIVIKAILKNKQMFNKYKIKIEKSIQKVIGNGCKIKWQFVKEIKSLKSGKYLYTISEIK